MRGGEGGEREEGEGRGGERREGKGRGRDEGEGEGGDEGDYFPFCLLLVMPVVQHDSQDDSYNDDQDQDHHHQDDHQGPILHDIVPIDAFGGAGGREGGYTIYFPILTPW